MRSLSTMEENLKKWSYESFGSVRGRLKDLRKQLEEVRDRNWRRGLTKQENSF